ncbi:MAG TPA: hypothetical protein DEP35_11690 [Deltaproteobacteria bacterium]|nr:hypothetical protein [Deltaproteobacteria bacterium]
MGGDPAQLAPSADEGTRLAVLTIDDFTPCMGQAFRLAHEGRALELVLERADSTAVPATQGARAGFSLEFRGPHAPVLPQRICRLEHPALGVLEIFLVPLGREEGGVRYEAVFG